MHLKYFLKETKQAIISDIAWSIMKNITENFVIVAYDQSDNFIAEKLRSVHDDFRLK